MKTTLFSLSFLALCAATTSAQTPAFIHGQKVLLDKTGAVIPPSPNLPPPAPLVGGADDCTTAATTDAITGSGPFAVNTGAATISALQQTCGGGCHLDVWFYWTSTTSGPVDFSLCGGATVDTVIAVWADGATPGTCPTTSIACNDDFCGLQSQLSFTAVAGTSYFLQIGAYGATTTYSGTFTIGPPPPPPTNDDCATPIAISGSGLVPVNTTMATTGTAGQTEALCNYYSSTTINKDVWFDWTPSMTGPVTVTTCGQMTIDTRIAVYAGTGCPVAGSAIACNDDEGYPGTLTCTAYTLSSTVNFTATCGQHYTIQFGTWSAAASAVGNFSIVESGTSCGPTAVPYCFGDGTGTACPCGNAGLAGNGCASSVNANGANLAASGSTSIANDTLVLAGSGMPNSSALYFQGTTQISTIFGDGLRCAGGSVVRLGTKSNLVGASQYPAAGDLSVSAKGLVTTPGTRTYQVWYRNAAAFCTVSTFNLTNGLLVTWN
jgi:hypothetical protein